MRVGWFTGGRTPRRRGVTLLKELAAAGVPTALASDNTRDQFYAYGDLDMLEVLRDATRIGHLDRPFAAWPAAVTAVPAAAMGLPAGTGTLAVGGGAVRPAAAAAGGGCGKECVFAVLT